MIGILNSNRDLFDGWIQLKGRRVRFLGIGLTGKVPDATTLVRFRKRLIKKNLVDDLPCG